MSLMQTNLEQAFKDYLVFKEYILENNKKDIEELKKEVAEKSLKKETVQEQIECYFEEFGERNILTLDFLEAQKKLYYYYTAYKDLIEVPGEIEEELKDFKIKTVFGIVGGKKEIVDKELYNSYKSNYLEYTTASTNLNQEATN